MIAACCVPLDLRNDLQVGLHRSFLVYELKLTTFIAPEAPLLPGWFPERLSCADCTHPQRARSSAGPVAHI